MPIYEYKAFDKTGKIIQGVVDSTNPHSARSKLKKEDFFVIDFKEESAKSIAASESFISKFFYRSRNQEIAVITRQLSTLLDAGLPLVKSLTAISEQIENKTLKKVVTQIRETVNEGNTLADALKKYPRFFSNLYINMIEVGESSGALEIVLSRLADFMERQNVLKNKIRSILVYPILMILIGFAVLFFLFTFVIPTITSIFEEMHQTLPAPTTFLISISGFMEKFWWLIIIGLIIFLFGLRQFGKTARGRLFLDNFKLKIPLVGQLIRKIAISRFARTLGTLLSSGVPLLQSFNIVKNIVDNKILANALESARESIAEGEDIATPLKRSKVFPPIVIHMITVGEQSGELEKMLLKISDVYENEVETTVTALTSIIEPIIILIIGLIVLFIVLAVLLPIFEMNQLVR